MAAPATDVLIRGAGPVGCTLALALQGSGLRLALIAGGHAKAAARAFRPIALSYASRLILERIGAWQGLAATAIETVHVSQAGGFGRARLEARDAGVPALGFVVDYETLCDTLRERVRETLDAAQAGDAPARCEVHAEGASDADEKRYHQHALVALAQFTPAPSGTAYERFTPLGPLALLPFAGRYAIVWSTHPDLARELAEGPDARFLEQLTATAGARPGTPVAVTARSVQPLALRVRATRVAARAVYIGNAAQSLHPVAGQGLNLGLRDAWELAQILREAADPGSEATLARYARARRLDAEATIRLTDALASAFVGTSRLARAARGLALTALDILPAPRRFFARRMIYGPSALP